MSLRRRRALSLVMLATLGRTRMCSSCSMLVGFGPGVSNKHFHAVMACHPCARRGHHYPLHSSDGVIIQHYTAQRPQNQRPTLPAGRGFSFRKRLPEGHVFPVLSRNPAGLPLKWVGFPCCVDCVLLPARGSRPSPCSQHAGESCRSLVKNTVKNFTFPGAFLGPSSG